MDVAALRAEFPVLERVAYLNTGTDGPIPRRAAEAARAELDSELAEGRGTHAHFARAFGLARDVRARLAGLLGCDDREVALTGSTTDGVNTVVAALELGAGDEVLTSDEEHPGVLAPLAAASRVRGFEVRFAPFAELAGEVRPATRLVACSHVSWVSGAVVDAGALAATDALVLLDGAQGLGAIPTDVRVLGCDFYAASGQKWLCGPDGTGSLYVRAELADELVPPWPSFVSLEDPDRPAELPLHPGARRLDHAPFPRALWACSLASLELLEEAGWASVHERAATLAAGLADALAEAGAAVAARGPSTLVSWREADAEAAVRRLAEEGVVVRFVPGWGLLRASVGAWSSQEELDRLVELAARR